MSNRFNQNDVNRGWQSMRQTLDREMPQKRRRRLLGWWWMAAGISICVISVGLWQRPAQKPTLPAAIPVQPPVVSPPVAVMPATETKTTPSIPVQSHGSLLPVVIVPNAENAEEEMSSTPIIALQNEPQTGNNEVPIQTDQSPLVSDQQHTGFALNSATDNEVNTKFNADENHVSDIKNVDNQGITGSLSEVNSTTEQGALPYAINSANEQMRNDFQQTRKTELLHITAIPESIRALAQPDPLKNLAVVPIVHIIKPLKIWKWGVTAGIGTEQFSLPNTASVGIHSDWTWPSKIGLRMGLAYTHAKPNTATRPLAAVWALEYAEASNDPTLLDNIGASAAPGNLTLSNSIIIPAKVLHRIEAPILCFWQPKRNFRLYGGMVINYTLRAHAARQNYATNDAYLLVSPKSSRSSLDELVSSKLPNWSLDWQGGVSVHLTRTVEIGLTYKRTLRLLQTSLQQQYRFQSVEPTNSNAPGVNVVQYYNRQLFSLQGTLFF